MGDEYIPELKKCLDKYWRIMALPMAERAPFSAGIEKLETRIEQLRAATGLDTDQFVKRAREAYHQLFGLQTLDDMVYDRVSEIVDRASACFRMGDQLGADTALTDLKAYCLEIAKTQKQEVFPL